MFKLIVLAAVLAVAAAGAIAPYTGLGYSSYSHSPLAYSAYTPAHATYGYKGYASPLAYSGYSGYPYSNGYTGYSAYTGNYGYAKAYTPYAHGAYSAYSAYPYHY